MGAVCVPLALRQTQLYVFTSGACFITTTSLSSSSSSSSVSVGCRKLTASVLFVCHLRQFLGPVIERAGV
uniref:Uncharacterized protein n=1 Tax=Anguilla anguilla TaxID=7936 RepID=A0A0E9TSI4_ANGAN